MSVAENDFDCNIQQMPFAESDLVKELSSASAIIDAVEPFFLRQSSKQGRDNLIIMYEEDLNHFNGYDCSRSDLKLLALLSARSVLQFYRRDVIRQLHCLLRPTDNERNVLCTMPTRESSNSCRDELTYRRNNAIKLFLKSEFQRFKRTVKLLFERYLVFIKQLGVEQESLGAEVGLISTVQADIIEKRATKLETILKVYSKLKTERPSIYLPQKKKEAIEGTVTGCHSRATTSNSQGI
jgi:hypothetical protein